jgi:hypothetical protein
MTAPRRSAAVLLVVLATLVAACGGEGTTIRAGNVTVVDTSGLLTAAVLPDSEPGQSVETAPSVVAGSSLRQLAVSWSGSSCVKAWTVRLLGGNALWIEVEAGDAQAGCEGTLASLGVVLDLNRVVDAASIPITLVEEGGS